MYKDQYDNIIGVCWAKGTDPKDGHLGITDISLYLGYQYLTL
jgi:hypothetical protein